MRLARRRAAAVLARRRRPGPAGTERTVRRILRTVERQGDEALFYWTEQLDRVRLEGLQVEPERLIRALDALADPVRAALERAVERVRAFHEAVAPPRAVAGPATDGVQGRLLREPLDRVAVYVPAGRWPLPSSVVMGVVPAQVAGVREIAVFTPPRPDGEADPTTLAAAAYLGVREVYRVGGAQAVGAAAFGTATVRPVDKLVGPGNRWVTEAKRQVQGRIGIDGLNGPSEVVVWAEPPCDPDQVARDLLAQAEHDPESWALVVSTDAKLLEAVSGAAEERAREWGVGDLLARRGVGAVAVDGPEAALAFVEEFAPEHLELWGEAERWRTAVRRAGAVFVGCPTPLGDYVAGPNHVLPTGGTARFASVLGVDDFLRRRTEVTVAGAAAGVVRAGAVLAAAEGLVMHQRALEAFAGVGEARS